MPEGAPITTRIGTTVAIVALDPAAAPTLRALFCRSFAGLGAVDGEAMTAESLRVVAAVVAARSVIATAGLIGIPAAAAVLTAPQSGDSCEQRDAARARAAATPAGKIALSRLASDLCRGSHAAVGDDGMLVDA